MLCHFAGHLPPKKKLIVYFGKSSFGKGLCLLGSASFALRTQLFGA
jgi:hypothetical protein